MQQVNPILPSQRFIRQIVSRLKIIVRKSDTLARIGADEFAIERLSLEVTASIAIAFYPDHGREADTIMQRANLALFNAKQDTKKD